MVYNENKLDSDESARIKSNGYFKFCKIITIRLTKISLKVNKTTKKCQCWLLSYFSI